MKKVIFFYSFLLVLWIAGASYWFVCKTMCDCRNSPNPAAVAEMMNAPGLALIAAAEEAKAFVTGAGVQKVYFETARGSTDMSLLPAGYTGKLKLFLDSYPETKVVVTGHTDSAGPEPYNMMLSELRAKYVRTWLVIAAGINADQIEITAKGISEPAAPNDTPEGREKNRRTEFYALIQ
jgi:hypothetical protein